MAVPYVTPAEIRDRVVPLESEAAYPDVLLAAYVSEFEQVAENYRGVAFTPREATEVYDIPVGGGLAVSLAWPKVRAVTTVTVDGSLVDSDLYRLGDTGTVHVTGSPFTGDSVTVVYSHGFDSPSSSLVRACVQYVRAVALADKSNIARDVIAQTSEGMTLRYSTPDKRAGRPTGFVEVDRLLNGLPNYRIPGIG